MIVVRRYRCDEGHEWLIRRSDGEKEHPEDSICPFGHVAVTCRDEYPVEDVQILIKPAARIVDTVKKQRILEGRYLLSIVDREGQEICTTIENYDWDKIVKIACFFRDKSIEQALEWWVKRNL